MKPLTEEQRRDLLPLVDIIARAAYEAILRGDYDRPDGEPADPDKSKDLHADRPAA